MRLPLLPWLLLGIVAAGGGVGACTYGVLPRQLPAGGRLVPLGSAPAPLAASGARLDVALALEQRGLAAEMPLPLPEAPGRVRLSKPGADGKRILALLREEGKDLRLLDAREVETLADPKLSLTALPGEPRLVVLQSANSSGAPEFAAFRPGGSGLEPVDYLWLTAPAAPAPQGVSVAVDAYKNVLYYFEGGRLSRAFRVATGKDFLKQVQATPDNSATPLGLFRVKLLEKDPAYTPAPGSSHKEKIAGGAADNPLGRFLIGLDADPKNFRLWAIHGNIEPGAIGNWASEGCIRLQAANLEWLFNHIPVETPVRIYRSNP